MKRLFVLLLAMITVISFAACSDEGEGKPSIENESESEFENESENGEDEQEIPEVEPEPVRAPARLGNLEAFLGESCAYIPLEGGRPIVIEGRIESAYMTESREKIVVLYKNGDIGYMNADLSDFVTVSGRAKRLSEVRNDGFIYRDTSDYIHRYSFITETDTVLCSYDDRDFTVAENSITALYTSDNGNICILAANSNEPIIIDSWRKEVETSLISNNGDMAVWSEETGSDSVEFKAYINGEVYSLGGHDQGGNFYPYVSITLDQKLAVVMNMWYESAWILRPGEAPFEVVLPDVNDSVTAYYQNGYLSDSNLSDVTDLYLDTEDGIFSAVYHVSLTGEVTPVLDDVVDFHTANGHIFYIDGDNAMHAAKLSGSSVSDDIVLGQNIYGFRVSVCGRFVYFYGDCTDTTGILYAYKIGDASAIVIDEKAAVADMRGLEAAYSQLTYEGNIFYYMKDFKDDRTYSGTYYRWTYGEAEAVEIAPGVIYNSPESGLLTYGIRADTFYFIGDAYKGDEIYGNLYYYDNGNITLLGEKVYR